MTQAPCRKCLIVVRISGINIQFSGAGYVESYMIDPVEYRNTIKEFLNTYFK